MSRRSALESVGAYFDDELPVPLLGRRAYMRMALRFPTGFLAVRDVAQRLHHPSLTSECHFDGEHWISYHHYHSAWFRRALPGVELPRQFDQLSLEAYIMAALDALEHGDRRKCAHYLRSAVRRDPRAAAQPARGRRRDRAAAGHYGRRVPGAAPARTRGAQKRDAGVREPTERTKP